MITAEEARKLIEEESKEREKARQKIYETYLDKIEILIKATCKLEDLSATSTRCCKVKFVDDKDNLNLDEFIFDDVVVSKIIDELETNGFKVDSYIKPSFGLRFNEFGSHLATGYIEISW